MTFFETFANNNSKFQHCSNCMVCAGSVVFRGQQRKGSVWTFKGFHLKSNFLNLDKSTHIFPVTFRIQATVVYTIICWLLFILYIDLPPICMPKGSITIPNKSQVATILNLLFIVLHIFHVFVYVCVYISYDIVLYLLKLYIFIYYLYFAYILHHLIFTLSILIVGPAIFFYNFNSLIFFSAEERNLGYFQLLVFNKIVSINILVNGF